MLKVACLAAGCGLLLGAQSAGAVEEVSAPPAWRVEVPGRGFSLGIGWLDDRRPDLATTLDASPSARHNGLSHQVTGPEDGPRLDWHLRGPFIQLPLTLLGRDRPDGAGLSAVVELGRPEVAVDLRDATNQGGGASLHGYGTLLGAGLELAAPLGSHWFGGALYRFRTLRGVGVEPRDPGNATFPREDLDRDAHEVVVRFGRALSAGRLAPFVGLRGRWTRLSLERRLDQTTPAGKSDPWILRARSDDGCHLAGVAGLDARLTSRAMARLETERSSCGASVLVKLVAVGLGGRRRPPSPESSPGAPAPLQPAPSPPGGAASAPPPPGRAEPAPPAGLPQPSPSESAPTESAADAAALATDLAGIESDFRGALTKVRELEARGDVAGYRTAARGLVDRTEERAVARITRDGLAGLADWTRDRFAEARAALAAETARSSALPQPGNRAARLDAATSRSASPASDSESESATVVGRARPLPGAQLSHPVFAARRRARGSPSRPVVTAAMRGPRFVADARPPQDAPEPTWSDLVLRALRLLFVRADEGCLTLRVRFHLAPADPAGASFVVYPRYDPGSAWRVSAGADQVLPIGSYSYRIEGGGGSAPNETASFRCDAAGRPPGPGAVCPLDLVTRPVVEIDCNLDPSGGACVYGSPDARCADAP
jgi:hypothetical protein